MLTEPPQGVNRAPRGRQSPYVVCGRHAALAFLRARPEAVERVLVSREAGEMSSAVRELGLPAHVADAATLERLSGGVPHQGMIAIGRPPEGVGLVELVARACPIIVALDGLTDPRNVGAIIRTAEAVGVGGIVMARDRAPGLSPALVKAAAGAVEWLPIARVVNLARALEDLRRAGHWVLGLDGQAEAEIQSPGAVPGFPCVLVVGAEGHGLRSLTRRMCDRLVRIPMSGRVESLNASIAAAVALYELRRVIPPSGRPQALGS